MAFIDMVLEEPKMVHEAFEKKGLDTKIQFELYEIY